jgi:hypothetical protein
MSIRRAFVEVLTQALARCFWRGHVDANDVKFDFAHVRRSGLTGLSTPAFTIAGLEQELVMWMLDNDKVRNMEQNKEGIKQAVRAFYQIDAYLLRPYFYGHTSEDVQLWKVFKKHFLEMSGGMLSDLSLVQDG